MRLVKVPCVVRPLVSDGHPVGLCNGTPTRTAPRTAAAGLFVSRENGGIPTPEPKPPSDFEAKLSSGNCAEKKVPRRLCLTIPRRPLPSNPVKLGNRLGGLLEPSDQQIRPSQLARAPPLHLCASGNGTYAGARHDDSAPAGRQGLRPMRPPSSAGVLSRFCSDLKAAPARLRRRAATLSGQNPPTSHQLLRRDRPHAWCPDSKHNRRNLEEIADGSA
jgi:hypothetical protein